jgi:hypothetical protein
MLLASFAGAQALTGTSLAISSPTSSTFGQSVNVRGTDFYRGTLSQRRTSRRHRRTDAEADFGFRRRHTRRL